MLPTYGRPAFLERAVESVLRQSFRNLELIVVDDNEEDSVARAETQTVIAKFEGPRLRYLKQPHNRGAPAARNCGIAAARGDLVTFLDDDDEYYQQKVERQVRQIEHGAYDVSLCGCHFTSRHWYKRRRRLMPAGLALKEFVLYGNALTPMIMIKKSLAQSVGGFDDVKRFQDHFFMFKVHEAGAAVGLILEPLYRYHDHACDRVSLAHDGATATRLKHERENGYLNLLNHRETTWLRFRQTYTLLEGGASRDEVVSRPEDDKVSHWSVLLKHSTTPKRCLMTVRLAVKMMARRVSRNFAARSRSFFF